MLASPLLWLVVLVAGALVWVPLVCDLVDELNSHSPVPSRRRQRQARAAAAAIRSRVGDRPEIAATHGHSPDRPTHARATVRRVMPAADATPRTASVAGLHTTTERQAAA